MDARYVALGASAIPAPAPAPPATRCLGSTLNTGLMSRTRAAGCGASPWFRPSRHDIAAAVHLVASRSAPLPRGSRCIACVAGAHASLRPTAELSRQLEVVCSHARRGARGVPGSVCMLRRIAPWSPPPDRAASASSVNGSALLLPAPLAPPACMARGAPPGVRQCLAVRRPGRPPHHAVRCSSGGAERPPPHQHSSASHTHAV